MTTTIDVLNRIAVALEKRPEVPFAESPFGAIILLVIGLILGYFGKMGREWQDREKQRKLLVSLLGDEIVLRWNQHIAVDFSEVLQEFNIKNVKALCTTHFQPSDLYIFKQCAENLPFTTSLQDNTVVSSVIHVHILSNDLYDGLRLLRDKYKEYEKAIALVNHQNEIKAITAIWQACCMRRHSEANVKNEIRIATETLKCVWDNLKTITERMDTQMVLIFSCIGKEYEKYVDGDCRRMKPVAEDLPGRIKLVAVKRFSNPISSGEIRQSKP